MSEPRLEYLLRLGDNALVLAQRLGEWIGHGPVLEEDIALANVGLDLLGQGRMWLSYAGEVEGAVTGRARTEDELAFLRDGGAFRNVQLVELPNGDFAVTMARQFYFDQAHLLLLRALAASADARIAEIAAKAVKEMAYHVRHAAEWTIRLGDGTDESRRRMLEASDELWSYTGELFEMDALETALAEQGFTPDRATIRPKWEATIARVFDEATLPIPKPRYMQTGARNGRHSEHLGHMLAEMQVLARRHPEAVW